MLVISWLKYFTNMEADAQRQAEERSRRSLISTEIRQITLAHTHFNKLMSVFVCLC